VEVSQEQEVHGVAPDIGLQGQGREELPHGRQQVTSRPDRGAGVPGEPALIGLAVDEDFGLGLWNPARDWRRTRSSWSSLGGSRAGPAAGADKLAGLVTASVSAALASPDPRTTSLSVPAESLRQATYAARPAIRAPRLDGI
jgi:hypothetical protein